jgi:uncharacterized protein (DUF488 family)
MSSNWLLPLALFLISMLLPLCALAPLLWSSLLPLSFAKTVRKRDINRIAMKHQIYTIGHSTHTLEAFIDLIKNFKITCILDIRTIPKSRHTPQFNSDSLKQALAAAVIDYIHLPKLGGLRKAKKNSSNSGWKNPSFRGFADYMQTSPFWEGIAQLEHLGKQHLCAIMCAEAVPWRCHRSLIADALKVRGWSVNHILSKTSLKPHEFTSFLRVDNEQLLYPNT